MSWLLRREGVYSSTLSQWRRQREEGTLSALKPKRRGRKIQEVNPLAGRVTELEREVQQLQFFESSTERKRRAKQKTRVCHS